MNIFVIFDKYESEESFLRTHEVEQFRNQGKLVTSSREPIVIFSGITPQEVSQIRNLASNWSGHILESRKYSPL